LFDGSKVDGPAGLRIALVGHTDLFLRNFTVKFLSYALGRGVEYYDMPSVRSIERESAKNDNRFSSFVLAIVKSTPFLMSRAPEAGPASDGLTAAAAISDKPKEKSGASQR
jgi:hypothetical protein